MSWSVGDIAQCVVGRETWSSKAPRWMFWTRRRPEHGPALRETIRVDAVRFANDQEYLKLRGYTAGYYQASCFRKLLPAEPCFVEAMRRLKEPVEA